MRVRLSKNIGVFFLPQLIILLQFARLGSFNLSWLLYIVLLLLVALKYRIFLSRTSLRILILVIIIWPLISNLWSIAVTFNSNVYFSIVTGLFVALFVCTLEEKKYASFINGIFFACVLFILLGIFESLMGRYLLVRNSVFMLRLNVNRLHYPIVAFANPNDLGQFLALLMPLSTVSMIEQKSGIRAKWLIYLFNLLCVYVLFNTESNISMIVYLGSYAIYLLIIRKGSKKSDYIKIAIIIVVCLVLAYILESKTSIISRIVENSLFVRLDDTHFIRRYNLYGILIESIINHPLGAFGNAYSFTIPHNFFLYIVSDFGVIGGILFIAYYVFLLQLMISNTKTDNSHINYILFASLLLFPLSSSISSGNEQRKAVWIFLGICMYYQIRVGNMIRSDSGTKYIYRGDKL